MDPTTTFQAICAWPVEDRLDLVARVWDRIIEDGWKPELTDDLAVELDRRLAAHESNPTNVRTWDQVLERLGSQR